ncbi:MAG: hypothetical protein CL607_17125 [Anaerolineaceae bacterium]|nr:hypothetical protein [Anaerolineaceae bacterium]
MDDLQRAQRLLNSPIEGDHRKAIKLLAKSGDRRALALLRQAYDNAQTAEIKQMALKGGAYLKENLRAEVLVPADEPITFDLPEDHYGLDKKDKPLVMPPLASTQLQLNVKHQKPKPERKVKPQNLNAARISYYACLIILLTGALVPWMNLTNMPLPSGHSLGQELTNANVDGNPNPAFSLLSIDAVLNSNRHPWYMFMNDNQLQQLRLNNTQMSMGGNPREMHKTEIVNQAIGATVLACVVTIVISLALRAPLQYKSGSRALTRRQREIAFVQQMPNRVLWSFILVAGLAIGSTLIIFLFDVAPRFIAVVHMTMNLGNPTYSTIRLLDWGFIMILVCCLAIIMSAIFALTSSD